ncbi:MAG TPA: glycosyltransferase family 2 protein [Rugosimonospora sp.]|nr:glycosyltransferase family 2 protein [Rugosimonospora sp.]
MTNPQPVRASSGQSSPRPTVSVVIPALNEAKNLPHVFDRLPADIDEILLVDGGSTDGTVEVAQQLRSDVIVVQQTRRGKGNALACGFAKATGDIIVMIDADGSTDPAEIPDFVQALLEGADYAKGSRFRPGGDSHDITRFRRLGNYGLNAIVNILFRTHYSDLCYGYNAFWRYALDVMDLPDIDIPAPADGSKVWGDGFEVETLINIRVAAHKLVISEVPSIEACRLHGVSNLNAFSDGSRVLRTIFDEYTRLRRERRAGRSRSLRKASAAAVAPVPPPVSPSPVWNGPTVSLPGQRHLRPEAVVASGDAR